MVRDALHRNSRKKSIRRNSIRRNSRKKSKIFKRRSNHKRHNIRQRRMRGGTAPRQLLAERLLPVITGFILNDIDQVHPGVSVPEGTPGREGQDKRWREEQQLAAQRRAEQEIAADIAFEQQLAAEEAEEQKMPTTRVAAKPRLSVSFSSPKVREFHLTEEEVRAKKAAAGCRAPALKAANYVRLGR